MTAPASDSTNLIFQDIARYRTRIFDRLMRAQGLTTSQAWVIAHLVKRNNQTQTELARRMGVGMVTLGGLVDRLESRGLVHRQTDSSDRRAKRVGLTAQAETIHDEMMRSIEKVDAITYRGLSGKERKALDDALGAVRGNLLDALATDGADLSADAITADAGD